VFGDLLSGEECDSLVELARAKLRRSPTIDNWSGGDEVTEGRTSEGMSFAPGENDVVKRIEGRIAELVNWPVDRGEGLQVLRYGPGAEYRPHHDYFDPTVPGAASLLKRGGARVATLVMYLKTSQKGGSTTFPDVGFQVAPIKGNAVFFSYDCPHPTTRTLHGGAPVIEGEKWIATKWLRETTFS
jgi:prolyl 4-hydroxylase